MNAFFCFYHSIELYVQSIMCGQFRLTVEAFLFKGLKTLIKPYKKPKIIIYVLKPVVKNRNFKQVNSYLKTGVNGISNFGV